MLNARYVLLLPIVVLVSSCSLVPGVKPVPIDKYVLENGGLDAGTVQRADLPVMIITVPRTHGGYDTSRIAYRQQAYGLKYFARSRWADTPSRMLAPLIAEAINSSGDFQALYASPGALRAAYRLDSELIDFYQDFTVQPSEMHISLRAQLVDLAGNRVIASQLFDIRQPAASENAYGGVQAANLAAQQLIRQLAGFCQTHTRR